MKEKRKSKLRTYRKKCGRKEVRNNIEKNSNQRKKMVKETKNNDCPTTSFTLKNGQNLVVVAAQQHNPVAAGYYIIFEHLAGHGQNS